MSTRASLVLAALLVACSSKDGGGNGGGPDGSSNPSGPGMAATVAMSDTINTVAFVSWSPPAAGDSWVEYGLEGANLDQSTPHVATDTSSHEQIVLGLKADHVYQWRAVTEVGGVRHESEIGELTTGAAPPGVAAVTISASDPTKYDPSPYLLTVTLGTDVPATVVIFDREGDPVWYFESPSTVRKAHTARPAWDGKSIVYGYYDQDQDENLGGIYRIAMDGRSVIFTPTIEADHDFVERQDGTFAYLHLDSRDDQDVEGDIVGVVTNAIYETHEGDDPDLVPPVEIYNQFDDSGQTLYWTCSHMEEFFEGTPYHQWTHGNSLMPDPLDRDNFYWVNYRYHDSLLRIDRTKGKIDWEIGGRYDDSDLTADAAFDHGHMSHFWPGGFLMFDNNTHDEGNSRVVEYSYDEASKHVQMDHEWEGEIKTPGLADARRTNSNTVIINWSGEDKIQERTYDDEVVWEMDYEGADAGRITLLHDLYDLDPPYDY